MKQIGIRHKMDTRTIIGKKPISEKLQKLTFALSIVLKVVAWIFKMFLHMLPKVKSLGPIGQFWVFLQTGFWNFVGFFEIRADQRLGGPVFSTDFCLATSKLYRKP